MTIVKGTGKPTIRIAIIGLGYVGLPLAVEFAKQYEVIGYDIDQQRIRDLSKGIDITKQIRSPIIKGLTQKKGKKKAKLTLTYKHTEIKASNCFIITVPTPIDDQKRPNLSMLQESTENVGSLLKKGDVVVYESTVYPGCTEEECIPILEQMSGLKLNVDFWVGYSPERINPGDKKHTLSTIRKITSGSTPRAAAFIDKLYASIILAGTYKAPSIKVAEAAKAIENAQRDVNISFVNELALIFDKMGIDTGEVLEAAATKWNFLNFRPGLVGGHCIGVDPYYLLYKSKQLKYTPRVILSGRKVNEQVSSFLITKILRLIKTKSQKNNRHILILGFTFKENCTDIRNTGVINLYTGLKNKGFDVDVYDPRANPGKVNQLYGFSLLPSIDPDRQYTAIIYAVAHDDFKGMNLKQYKQRGTIIFDISGTLSKELSDGRL